MNKNKSMGYLMTFASYVIWGMLAIYWKQLSYLSSAQLLAVRLVASVVTMLIVIHLFRSPIYMDYLKDKKKRWRLFLTSVLITVNWAVFVYAINAGYVLQASLGYYINPLVSMFLGIFVLKEKLSKIKYIAIGFAAAGVLYITLGYGQFPWISLILAFSFGLYGLLKKLYQLDSLNSLFVETAYFIPIMLIILLSSDATIWVNGVKWYQHVMVAMAGVVTIIPLLLFNEGAKRIPLSAVGFLQYIAPTMMLFIGVTLYGEAFTEHHVISFGLIWFGLLVYSVDVIRLGRQEKIMKSTKKQPYLVEKADKEDAKAIFALQKQAFLSEGALNNDYDIPPLVEAFEDYLDDFDNWVYLKVVDKDSIVGAIRGKVNNNTCYVGRAIVDEAYQNNGIGTKLVHAIEANFKNVVRFELFTGKDSKKNIYLYEKLGYQIYNEKRISDKTTLVYMEK